MPILVGKPTISWLAFKNIIPSLARFTGPNSSPARALPPPERQLDAVTPLLARYALEPVPLEPGPALPGTSAGESEAGLIGNRIYFRPDTPLHSVLHEACHFICMDDARRSKTAFPHINSVELRPRSTVTRGSL